MALSRPCSGVTYLHHSETAFSPTPQLVPTRDSIHRLQTQCIHVRAACEPPSSAGFRRWTEEPSSSAGSPGYQHFTFTSKRLKLTASQHFSLLSLVSLVSLEQALKEATLSFFAPFEQDGEVVLGCCIANCEFNCETIEKLHLNNSVYARMRVSLWVVTTTETTLLEQRR